MLDETNQLILGTSRGEKAEWQGVGLKIDLASNRRGFSPWPKPHLVPWGLRGVVACIWDNDAEMAGYIYNQYLC